MVIGLGEGLPSRWYFKRRQIASRYLDLFEIGSGAPMTLFGKRKIGKTWFLLHEVLPEAVSRGWRPIYIDLWTVRNDPLAAFNGLLQRYYHESRLPQSDWARALRTPVKGVGLFGSSLTLGDAPTIEAPDNPYLQFGHWLRRIVMASDQPVILLIDEIQTLGNHPDGSNIGSTLRSELQQLAGRVFCMFTGSSRAGLAKLFSAADSPLYDFGQTLHLPVLDTAFVSHVSQKAYELTGRMIPVPLLEYAFDKLSNLPAPFLGMVGEMVVDKSADVGPYIAKHRTAMEEQQSFQLQWGELKAMQQAVLYRLARDLDVFSQEAMDDYCKALGIDKLNLKAVQSALDVLQQRNLVAETSRRRFSFEADAFKRWIKDNI